MDNAVEGMLFSKHIMCSYEIVFFIVWLFTFYIYILMVDIMRVVYVIEERNILVQQVI